MTYPGTDEKKAESAEYVGTRVEFEVLSILRRHVQLMIAQGPTALRSGVEQHPLTETRLFLCR